MECHFDPARRDIFSNANWGFAIRKWWPVNLVTSNRMYRAIFELYALFEPLTGLCIDCPVDLDPIYLMFAVFWMCQTILQTPVVSENEQTIRVFVNPASGVVSEDIDVFF